MFAAYSDDLLKNLRYAGVGYHNNGIFTGAFMDTNDITLIDLSRESISYMLQICEQCATKHDILLNLMHGIDACFSVNAVNYAHLTQYILNTTA